MSYKLKYTGQQVEEYLERVASGQGGGGTEDYNDLKNKPIINADLANLSPSAANQTVLYHHVGESTSVYEKNVLYYTNGESWLQFKGETPDISVSATVDNNVGTPLVVVTKNGTKENPSFILGFQNLKGTTGKTGEKGETGLTALTYSKTNAALQAGTFNTDLGAYNRTPLIGEICVYFSTAGYCGTGIIQEINSNIVTVRTVGKVSTTGPQGATGATGDEGPKGDTGNAIYLYDGLLDSSVTEVPSTQVTIPEGRRLQPGDILISTYENSFGALASVSIVMGLGGTATVEFIGNLSTGGGGGTALNEYTYSINIKPTGSYLTTIRNILNNAKRIINVDVGMEQDGRHSFMTQKITSLGWEAYSITAFSTNYYVHHVSLNMNTYNMNAYKTEYNNPSFSTVERTIKDFSIRYINDTEIT